MNRYTEVVTTRIDCAECGEQGLFTRAKHDEQHRIHDAPGHTCAVGYFVRGVPHCEGCGLPMTEWP